MMWESMVLGDFNTAIALGIGGEVLLFIIYFLGSPCCVMTGNPFLCSEKLIKFYWYDQKLWNFYCLCRMPPGCAK